VPNNINLVFITESVAPRIGYQRIFIKPGNRKGKGASSIRMSRNCENWKGLTQDFISCYSIPSVPRDREARIDQ